MFGLLRPNLVHHQVFASCLVFCCLSRVGSRGGSSLSFLRVGFKSEKVKVRPENVDVGVRRTAESQIRRDGVLEAPAASQVAAGLRITDTPVCVRTLVHVLARGAPSVLPCAAAFPRSSRAKTQLLPRPSLYARTWPTHTHTHIHTEAEEKDEFLFIPPLTLSVRDGGSALALLAASRNGDRNIFRSTCRKPIPNSV